MTGRAVLRNNEYLAYEQAIYQHNSVNDYTINAVIISLLSLIHCYY